MGIIRTINTVTGTLDGVAHEVTGTSSRAISGYRVDSYDVTTSYTEITYPANVYRQSVLIYNDGADELYVRYQSTSGAVWSYCIIPPGAPMEFHAGAEDFFALQTSIYRLDIKAQTSTSRAIVHQVWI